MQDIQTMPPAVTGLARQVFVHEAGLRPESATPDALAVAFENVHMKLQQRLTDLIGQAGFVALFGRALHLARRESPVLAGISIDAHPPHTLQGAREFALANVHDAAAAFTSVVARVIWLLITFIGEQLGTQLIVDIWPKLKDDPVAHGGADS